jgi:pSer/pThr/pTyr-binding forkhead associated (FHA) protein
MPTLTLKFKDTVINRYPIEKGTSLTIGRRKESDIVIDNLAVSGHHARIDCVGETFVLVDLQSKNGTFVNEQLVNSHRLKHGDDISIGKHLLVFSSGDTAAAAETPPPEFDKTMVMDTSNYRSMVQKSTPVVPEPLRRQSEPIGCLTYLSGGQGRLDLTQKLIKIGKDPTSEIVVKGFFIGATAATISRRPDGYYLSRAGGMAKPRINGQTVQMSVQLQNLDLIQIGPVKLKFFLKEPSAADPA